ncbi:MAM and LDL-receptor class A domain-containing protein 1-like [Mytilus californianus]|uniref:MAM and LDL-receptor class A domain-containing protein 1-like n=1 Tax=Mytilus californianus TaxID=6549 RepID=UPI00224550E5|nr:MAM and LDL-receptor class A domain-containing protein 1-like [Mytilus californianus]
MVLMFYALGSKGENGLVGEKGVIGLKGEFGVQGLNGLTGGKGTKGYPGNIGSKGLIGRKGLKGDTGYYGYIGLKGEVGTSGNFGDNGQSGIQGPKGEIGSTGGKGFQGNKGAPGRKGSTGVKGDQGNFGSKGQTGITGPGGNTANTTTQCDCIRSTFHFTDPTNTTLTLPEGGFGVLDCSAEGPQDMNFSIVKDGVCNTFNGTQRYMFNRTKFSDSGTYVCIISLNGERKLKTVEVFISGRNLCDFENGLCDWTQDENNDTDNWIVYSGHTPSTRTGPDVDHTYGNSTGHYLYLEASSKPIGDNVILKSQTLSSSAYCLSFSYHMYGNSMGSLNVYVQDCHNPKLHTIWSKSGDKGQAWMNACLYISKRSKDHQLAIEAVRGSGYYSDIAIDDLVISAVADNKNCSCFNIGYDDFCDFDNDLCHWTQGTVDNLDWTRWSGPTSSVRTGPSVDHTTGMGYYIYLESNNHNGQKAELISEYIQGTSEYCLSFFYHMFGVAIGHLDIFKEVQQVSGSTTRYKLLSLSGNKGDSWLEQKLSITSQSTFRIILSGEIGGDTSDIAVDDIRITSGQCK